MPVQTEITAKAPVFDFYAGGIKVVKPTGLSTLPEVIDWVRTGKYADVVAKIRAAASEKEAKFLKKYLDYVTFSGAFAPIRDAGNLVEHSGYIVIDFDNNPKAADLKLQLETDSYVTACFLSPRGEGVKAVIRIKDPSRHKETFADLAYYFNNVYRLTDKEKVDPSGSDVSRACFLSHDPTAFYNPDSKIYAIQNLIPVTAPRTIQQVAQDASQTEKHIAAIVDRIEATNMAVCNTYQELTLISFSLSTLGEPGRTYLHRICSKSDKYDEKYTDEKFDNAIKTSRFTTAAYFFSLCKDYGIDVSRPKAEKPDKKEPATNKLTPEQDKVLDAVLNSVKEKPEKKKKNRDLDLDEEDEDTLGSVWYTAKGGMKIRGGKWFEEVASNFQVFIKYRTEDENEAVTWILEIRKAIGDPVYLEVIHDDFCSARKLKNLLAAKQLGFKLKDNHLDELQSYLFTKTQFSTASKVLRYGFHPASSVYFFANKALNLKNNELLTPDEFGIVEANKIHLSVPQHAKDKQYRYTLTNQQVSFSKFWDVYAKAHLREEAFIPTCFYIFSLYRDMGLKFQNFSPILYLKGGAGTGKSSMIRTLTATFGHKQAGVNLKTKNTDSSLVKIMSQASNSIIWMDEFWNGMPNEGLLQAAYDNDGYHKSTSDFNSIDTMTVDIYSALALTSNYIPENDIFFSRCIFIPIAVPDKSEQQKEAYDEMVKMVDAGMGSVSVELLKYRSILEANDNYAVSYSRLYNGLKFRFKGQSVPERLFSNMSQAMAAALVFNIMGFINLCDFEGGTEAEVLSEFIDQGARCISRQFRIQSDSKAATEFFQIIQTLFEEHKIHEGFHFRFYNDSILLNFRKLYHLFAERYRRQNMKNPPDRDTIEQDLTTLSGKREWAEISKGIRFNNDGEGKSTAPSIPQTGSCELNYKQLEDIYGLDLKNRSGQNI